MQSILTSEPVGKKDGAAAFGREALWGNAPRFLKL